MTLVPPLGSGQDDAPNIAAAARQGPVELAPGTYVFRSPCDLPTVGAEVVAHPLTVLQATMPVGTPGAYQYSVFRILADPGTSAGADFETTLTSAVTDGSDVIYTADPPPAGEWLFLSNPGVGNIGTYARVLSVAAATSAPYAVTVDRPMAYGDVLAMGSSVVAERPAQRTRLVGNGATISGAADRAWTLWGAQWCDVSDWRVDTSLGTMSPTEPVGSHVYGYGSGWRRIVVLGPLQIGVAFESSLLGYVEDCMIDNVRGYGVWIADSRGVRVTGTTIQRAAQGGIVALTDVPPGTTTLGGSRNIEVTGGELSWCGVGIVAAAPWIVRHGDVTMRGNTVNEQILAGGAVDG